MYEMKGTHRHGDPDGITVMLGIPEPTPISSNTHSNTELNPNSSKHKGRRIAQRLIRDSI